MIRPTAFLALVAVIGCHKRADPPVSVATALGSIIIKPYAQVPTPAADGGAFASLVDTVVLATGDGAFYLVEADNPARLDIPAPFDRDAYAADWPDPKIRPRMRLTGAVISPGRLYVAHQAWNRDARCFTMRVASIALSAGMAAAGAWETVYITTPCLPFKEPFDDSETGGRLARAPDGDLFLTVGDHGFAGLDGSEPLAQADGDYGKIIRLSHDGQTHLVISSGHRNPQGLTLTADGLLWSTEHGPQGGDELNLIQPGRNYGWPLVTYGTNYGATTWPLNLDGHDHGRFEEPATAFVPSVATSALIEVGGDEFPQWRSDLLIGSLRAMGLYRARLVGTRVAYVEAIPVGERIRDLVLTPQGTILIWVDSGVILEITRSRANDAYARYCAGCHDPAFGSAAGPPLRSILGREIASRETFDYSEALRGLRGQWTEAQLDAFLADPAAFAPGTTMRLPPLDAESRAAIIAHLRTGQ